MLEICHFCKSVHRVIALVFLGGLSSAGLLMSLEAHNLLTYALWPVQGGLAMPLSQFTYPLVTAGALLMVFSLIGFPWLVSKYSPLTLGKYGMILISPMVIMLPLASVIRGSAIAQQVYISAST